jgi:drug/metabolite transporter (DMT)-like permease
MTHRRIATRLSAVPAPLRGALWMVATGFLMALLAAQVRHVTAGGLHPFETAFFRNLFGLLFTLPWLWGVGLGGLFTGRLGVHAWRSASGLFAMLLLFSALARLPIAEVMALTFTAPLFATAGAALVLGEKVRRRRWLAVAVGFAGAMVVLRPGSAAFSPAALLALGAAAFMATSQLIVKSLAGTEDSRTIVLYLGLLLTPLSLPPALLHWTWPAAGDWPWLAAMGLTASVAQLAMARAFAAAEASAVLPFDFARLIFAAGIGYLWFGEGPDAWTWLGGGMIFAATVYIAQRESRLVRRRPAEVPPPLA